MTKSEFIKKFSKIEDTFEDEFKAEYNSPELIWKALKEKLLLHSATTRTFRFSGIRRGRKFVIEVQAVDRESAIVYFELKNPELNWRTTTEFY